jgi:protein involved in polysaccharide export with SLBB domain
MMKNEGDRRQNVMCELRKKFQGIRHLWGRGLFASLSLVSFVVLLTFVLSACTLLADSPSPVSASVTNAAPGTLESVSTNATMVSSADAINSMEALDDKYKLALGDRLSFKIIEDDEPSKSLQITDSGDLEFPYIGRFPAFGKTCKQLANELKAQFEKDYYQQATVIVAVDFKAKSQGKVYLVGCVGSPGPQEIPSDEEFTLSKAILRAGGFTDFANQHNVRVTRQHPGQGSSANQTFNVDVGKILSKGKTDLDLVLEPGDLIYIPEKMIRF